MLQRSGLQFWLGYDNSSYFEHCLLNTTLWLSLTWTSAEVHSLLHCEA